MRTDAFPPTVSDDDLFHESPDFEGRDEILSDDAALCGATGRYSTADVAALPVDRVDAMSRRELIDVVRSVRGGHLLPGVRERLPQMDRETLRRLVFLTRRFCRNQQRLREDANAGVAVACR